jgi:hypothetical protein
LETNWVAAIRYADLDVERARWRATLNYRLLHTLQVGVEYNPVVGEVGPLATWFLLTEGDRRPALFVGTSSDRIGTSKGEQSYYATAAKHLEFAHASPYVSLNYSEADVGWNVPFGATFFLGYGLSVRPMYDGERSHLVSSLSRGTVSVSLINVWFENVGAAVSVGF